MKERRLTSSKYHLPHAVYMQMKYMIEDYERMKSERLRILSASRTLDGQPRSTTPGDPTANTAIKLMALTGRIEGIDKAIHDLNAHFQGKVKRGDEVTFDSLSAFADYAYFCYILYDPDAEEEPSYKTWKRFRNAFAIEVAKNLDYL